MAEKLVPLVKDGVPQSIAVDPGDFFKKPLYRDADGEMVTYADAGFGLSDYYESMEPYDGPKTKRAMQYRERKAQEERAPADEKAPARAEAKKGD